MVLTVSLLDPFYEKMDREQLKSSESYQSDQNLDTLDETKIERLSINNLLHFYHY